jgi:quinol-cytochrome oxidoreductase complex cytochrome b subunit
LLLTYVGGQPPEGTWLIMSRIGAAYYFVHFFLVLPFVGKVERPLPLPISISKAVLQTTGSATP